MQAMETSVVVINYFFDECLSFVLFRPLPSYDMVVDAFAMESIAEPSRSVLSLL